MTIKRGQFVRLRRSGVVGRVTRCYGRTNYNDERVYAVRIDAGPVVSYFERDLIPLDVIQTIAVLLHEGPDFARPRRASRRKPLFPPTGYRRSEW